MNMITITIGIMVFMFVCAMHLVLAATPEFKSLVLLLHDFLELVCNHGGKGTKRSDARVDLVSLGWQFQHSGASKACSQAVIHLTTLYHHHKSKTLSIVTDASDYYWTRIVTEAP